MQKIGALRYAPVMSLSKKWSMEEYEKLEEARLLAQKEEHWLEELQCLVDQVSILIKYQGDKQLFYAANKRLKELSVIFDMDDEAFKAKFQEKYMSFTDVRILKQVDPCLRGFYDYFYERADFMLAHLQLNTAILCGKAILKISALSSVVSFEDKMESLFQIAVGYGNQREVGKAMEYYNKAISLAKESDDTTYQYIAIIRKLSICFVANDLSIHADVDVERITVVQELLSLCATCKLNPYQLGQKLLNEEQSKFKKDRIKEAMPVLDSLLSLQRGDSHTASLVLEELKNAELNAYGSVSEYSNSETLEFVYQLLYNSAARAQESVIDNAEVDEREDIPYEIPTPPGMAPCDKFRLYLSLSKAECVYKHIQCSMYHAVHALEIAENMFSDYHEAMAIHAIGQAYESCGNISEAIRMYQMVVDMFRNPDLVNSDLSLSNQLLYNTLYEIGNLQKESEPEKATDVLTESISLIDESSDMDKDFFKLNALISRSIAFKYLGKVCSSESDMIKAIDMVISQTSKRLKFMDGDSRDNYWNETIKVIKHIVSLCDETSGNDLRVKLYELVLFSKGFLLSSEHALRTAISSENVPKSIRSIYEELEEYEQKRNPWGTSTENSTQEYVDHYLKKMRLTCAMLSLIDKYHDFVNQDYNSIAKCLDDNDLVVDFFDYETDDNDQQYMAFVYQKGSLAPELVEVCKESEIQKIFDKVSAMTYSNGDKYHFTEVYNPQLEYSNLLYQCIFGSIAERVALDSKHNLHVIPSGSLHKIPFESLVVSEGSTTIASDYYNSIGRFSHARVLKNRMSDCAFDNIEMFGGLDYGHNDASVSDERGYTLHSNDPEVAPLRPWGNLTYSIDEVNNIEFMWQSAKDDNSVRKYVGSEGTDGRFYDLHGKKTSVIHIATHGFFESRDSASSIPALKGRFSPMDLSGIVMSNGNEGWLRGSFLHHEGIITASDIAKMDLRDTSLVVLSACNSGSGIVRSDGVYGLQRAFKKAGAKSVLMSLWSESDAAGELFMTTFYRSLLLDGCSLADSYNNAKREVKRSFPDPKKWANFVLLD